MANVLKMAIVQSIQQLHAAGWSQRRIAKELGIDRGTVARRLRAPPPDSNAAIVPTGSSEPNAATFSHLPAPPPETLAGSDHAGSVPASNAAIVPTGSEPHGGAPTTTAAVRSPCGRPGQCEPYSAVIQAKLDQQLSAQRIWQDLRSEHGFAGGYDSVKRFVRCLGTSKPLPFRRMECQPGEEPGQGARFPPLAAHGLHSGRL